MKHINIELFLLVIGAFVSVILISSCSKNTVVEPAQKDTVPIHVMPMLAGDPDTTTTMPGQNKMIWIDGTKPCIAVPNQWCFNDIAVTNRTALSAFIVAIGNGTYAGWLGSSDNMDFVVGLVPSYKEWLEDCAAGSRELSIQYNETEKVGILIGYKNSSSVISYTNHEGSMILDK